MRSKSKVFLDYASTTPVDSRVIEAMQPYFNQFFGNPSSIHTYGQQAERALEASRTEVASYLNCESQEIIFTSCGSESDNLALRGVALAQREIRGLSHIIISSVEHPAISNTARQLKELYGFEVELLPVDHFGIVDPEQLTKYIRSDTAIVSVIYANNEIGSINPIAEIGEICHSSNVPFHTDAVQGAAHLPVDVEFLNVDLMSIGAHKFYGPKGIGALYVRQGTPILPILTGGSQESGMRGGTSNIPYIVGLARAFELAQEGRKERMEKFKSLRDKIISHIITSIPASELTGHPINRLPNHASFVFQGVDGNTLLMMLDAVGFACSSGSACKTGDPEPSDILLAMGYSKDWAFGSLRITLGQMTTSEEIEAFLEILPEKIKQNRDLKAA